MIKFEIKTNQNKPKNLKPTIWQIALHQVLNEYELHEHFMVDKDIPTLVLTLSSEHREWADNHAIQEPTNTFPVSVEITMNS